MSLLLLKLRAVELESRSESRLLIASKLVYILGKTVQDMVLGSNLWQIASSQVTLF